MKFFVGLLVVALALEGVLALPARSPTDDVEEIDVPRRSGRPRGREVDDNVEPSFRDFRGVIDTGSGYPFLQPAPHPFSFNLGFFDSFEDIFRRLHSRLLPALGGGSGDDGDSSEDGGVGVGFGLNPASRKGNTTSTVKIVDGHKIEINDTVYGDENSVFKVRIVNVRPLESGEEGADGSPVTSAPASGGGGDNSDNEKENDDAEDKEDTSDDSDERREPLADKKPDENEIKGNIDDPEIVVAIEMLPTANGSTDALNLEAAYVTDNSLDEGDNNNNDDDNLSTETEQTTDLEQGTAVVPELEDEDAEEEEAIDLEEESDAESIDDESETTRKNQRQKERENFESSDDEEDNEKVVMSPEYNNEWGLAEEEEDLSNELSNDIEQDVEVDLSNDLLVNDIAASQPGFPLNPDAELIEVDGGARTGDGSAMMARFEKLSMGDPLDHQAYNGK